MFGGYRHCSSGDTIFVVCHMILQDQLTQGLSNFMGRYFKVSRHSAKFGSHCHFGSGYIMVLVYHVISQDCIIKKLCDIMGESSSW